MAQRHWTATGELQVLGWALPLHSNVAFGDFFAPPASCPQPANEETLGADGASGVAPAQCPDRWGRGLTQVEKGKDAWRKAKMRKSRGGRKAILLFFVCDGSKCAWLVEHCFPAKPMVLWRCSYPGSFWRRGPQLDLLLFGTPNLKQL